VAVVQDVVDQAATLVAILVVTHLVAIQVAILVATLVATRVVTQVATLQGVGEVPQLLLSSQALGLPMEGHMEGLMEGGPTVHTPLGLLALCVAETQSSTKIGLVCLALILVSTFESLSKTSIGQLIRKRNKKYIKVLSSLSCLRGCVWIIASSFHQLLGTKM